MVVKHDPHLANDLVIQSLMLKIERLTARIDALEQRERDRALVAKMATQSVVVAVPQAEKRRAAMAEICAAVAAAHGVSMEQMRAKFGPREITDARAEFCHLAREQGLSTPQIGRFLGGRDHTTVLHLAARHKEGLGK